MTERPEPTGDQVPERLPYPPGSQIQVRDETWLVKTCEGTRTKDGHKIEAVGVSELVQDEPATFFSGVDAIEALDPRKTRLVTDGSPNFRRSRLYLEAVLRKTPLPQSERGLALTDRFLVDPLPYQQRPAELALSMENLLPRILIADVVGLGKTLEIGLTLAELIRRGRGDRILVVTPEHILEQFQQELWTRFSIPLVRLDSIGIQRIQREIPAGRNPFTYYKRVIVSVDTLKNIGQYRHHLEHIRWDAVVIDESHNLINPGSQRRALAETLAPNTDALILASATPHNGDRASFAGLVSLLDPTAITDPQSYDPEKDLRHLFIRRTKVSPEVREQVQHNWAERGPTDTRHCAATPAEEAVFQELATHWIPEPLPESTEFGTADEERARRPLPVTKDRLFAYQLLKSFLSSHVSLSQTIKARLKEQESKKQEGKDAQQDPATEPVPATSEQTALRRLQRLVEAVDEDESSGGPAKLEALIEKLRESGVGPRSDTRVVIFSERIETVKWLAEVVPTRLGFPKKDPAKTHAEQPEAHRAARVLFGSQTDQEQLKTIRSFELSADPVRLLFTSDVASEGVNFHHRCHELIHYDIPWSLIRIEQRNGRIDRYGQTKQPEFCALLLTSQVPEARDDRVVAEKVLQREEEAYKVHGSVEGETGYYRAEREDDRLTRDLIAGRSVQDHYEGAPAAQDRFATLIGASGRSFLDSEPLPSPARAVVPTLFAHDTADFVETALDEIYDENPQEAVRLSVEHSGGRRAAGPRTLGSATHFSLSPAHAPDLAQRLRALPSDYVKKRHLKELLTVTFNRDVAKAKLEQARDGKETSWPGVSFLTDIHPVVEWLVDKVLVRFGRQEAPVLTADVSAPTFLVQGMFSNAKGRPTVVEWMAVSGLPDVPEVEPMDVALAHAGVGPGMTAVGRPRDVPALQELVPAAVDAAAVHLESRRRAWDETLRGPLESYRDKLRKWQQDALPHATHTRRRHEVSQATDQQNAALASLETTDSPLLRVLAVLDAP